METYTDESTHTSLFHSHECCTAVFVSSLRIFPAFVGFASVLLYSTILINSFTFFKRVLVNNEISTRSFIQLSFNHVDTVCK